jgi:hypothetical protein
MKEEDLNSVIEILSRNVSEENAHFEFTYDDNEYCHVRSNIDGILIFTKELLSTVYDFKENHENLKKGIPIKTSDWFINDDDFFAPFITPLYVEIKKIKRIEPYKETLKDKLLPYFLMLCLLIFIIGFFSGIFQLLSWW